jgi:hypothetical protein
VKQQSNRLKYSDLLKFDGRKKTSSVVIGRPAETPFGSFCSTPPPVVQFRHPTLTICRTGSANEIVDVYEAWQLTASYRKLRKQDLQDNVH